MLEIRLTTHAQTHYHLRDGTEIDEPPSVEGYVERIKPTSQAKQPLYLSIHNGLLFFQPVDKAYPPTPPGLALSVLNLDSSMDGLRRREVERGINQVMNANAVCDLRNVVTVRRAFQILHPSTHDQKDTANEEPIWIWPQQVEEATQDDNDDEGGETALLHVADRAMVRVRRSFELLLTTGQVLRFEVSVPYQHLVAHTILEAQTFHSRRIPRGWQTSGSTDCDSWSCIGNTSIG